ncbi:MAG: CHAP domain-containing protein [Spirochaetales bacterium]|nr:CHAP domain-containing protein [Spirochaetales bacterium]
MREIGNNEGWENVFFEEINMSFQELMETVGWEQTHAWCAYFGKAVWLLGYSDWDSTMVNRLKELMSANAVRTYRNLKDAGFAISDTPIPGALVIWQKYKNGKPTIYGHEGIVVGVGNKYYNTIEGNTNSKGSRDGDQVADKKRPINSYFSANGLNRLGFVYPKEV